MYYITAIRENFTDTIDKAVYKCYNKRMNTLNMDIEHLSSLLKSFYTLTKIKIVVYGADFEGLLAYPDEDGDFCSFVKNSEDTAGKCDECAKLFCERCKRKKDLYVDFCHAGLTEVIFPLMNGETIIGYIMFGQTSLFNSHDELAKKVTDSLKGALTLDERSRLLLNNIKLKTEEELNSAAEILKSIANYIIIKNYLSQKKTYLMQEIQRYVLNNIDRPIKIPELCKTLLISKTKLYNVIKPEFKNGLTEYILAVKTEKARDELLNSDKTLDEIAKDCGIQNGNYLSKLFKKKYGVSPHKYKKEILRNKP